MVAQGRWQVHVLGPLRVQDGAGDDVTPPGILQRRLLALLVLHRGRVVSIDAALDALWPAAPPADPTAALQNHVSRLRRTMPGAIDSVAGGYRLDPATVALDADRLAAWLADDGGPTAGPDVDGLLRRWSGPAYPDLDEVDEARIEAARLLGGQRARSPSGWAA